MISNLYSTCEGYLGYQSHGCTRDLSGAYHLSKLTIPPRTSKPRSASSNKKNAGRVVVPNVAYLMNLPEHIASDEALRSQRLLGQYGRIEKVILHKNGTAHVTFTSINAAQLCIKSLDNFHYCGSRISALVGTTKYPEDVDLNKIIANSQNEPPPLPCPNPVFPSPMSLSPRRSSIGTESYSAQQTRSRCSSEVSGLDGLVFGTGGMVHSMWVSSSGSTVPLCSNVESDNQTEKTSAFVPVLFVDDDSSLSKSLGDTESWEVGSISEASLTSQSNSKEAKEVEDFWSSSSEGEISSWNGDDLDSSLMDDSVSIDEPADTRSDTGTETTDESREPYSAQLSLDLDLLTSGPSTSSSMPFSPCKEMVQALTAHVWKPSKKNISTSNTHDNQPISHTYNSSFARPKDHTFAARPPVAYGYNMPMTMVYPNPYMHLAMPTMMMQFTPPYHPHVGLGHGQVYAPHMMGPVTVQPRDM